MIVIVAILLFGLLALGGLVIDIGLVRLTQGQMQVGADPAALEGLRLRDAIDVNEQPLGDAGRRQAASTVASLVYDDDLDPMNAPTQPFLLGAGPEFELSGGITDLNASQLITLPDQRTYLPILQPNLANHMHGDMVAGTFMPPGPVVPSHEDAGYARNDFTPSDQAGSATASAFLVRLRRTNDFAGLDNQAEVSSSGTALPLLLGHGSAVTAAADNSGNYSVRHHGFTVRATAIVDARPALRVGLPQPDAVPSIEGVTPFALDVNLWNGLPIEQPVALTVDEAGTISGEGLPVAGRFTLPPPIPPAPPDPAVLTTVGQVVLPAAPEPVGEVAGYVPIYQVIDEGGVPAERVIGFGRAAVAGVLPALSITRLPGSVAPANATGVLSGGVPVLPDPAEWAVILEANRTLADAVLAPVLVR